MEMELNIVLNQSNYDVFVKMIEIKKIKNPKNRFQDSTKDFIKKRKLKQISKVPFEIKNPTTLIPCLKPTPPVFIGFRTIT